MLAPKLSCEKVPAQKSSVKANDVDMEKYTINSAPRFSVEYMDRSANPRIDFYRYAVGKWVDENPVPPDKTSWGSFYELYEWNMKALHEIAEKCAADIDAPPGSCERIVGDFYASAMDEKRIEDLRFAPIEDLWKTVSEISSVEDLAASLPRLHASGVSAFFDFYSEADKKASSTYTLYLYQGGLSLPDRDYYLLDSFKEVREYFHGHIKRMFALKGIDESIAASWSDTIIEIETELAKASRSATDLRDDEKNYNKIEISNLEPTYSRLKLPKYLSSIGVGGVDYIVIGQPEFFNQIEEMLEKRSVDDLKVYLMWHILKSFSPLLHKEVYDEWFDMFGRKLRGQQQTEPRWKRAIDVIDSQVGEALGKLYVESHFDSGTREKALALVGNVISAFRERLEKVSWMSDETRVKALEKLDKMHTKIGYPDKFRDYSSILIRRDDYAGNVRRSAEFESKRQASRVGKPVDPTEWYMTPPTVDAYYSPERNEIVFPAGIFQPSFFDPEMDDAVNYGAIGAVMGHEITHGFDDQGRHYDPEGNMWDWWNEEDAKKFNELAEEVVKEYSAQEALPGVFINGELTLGENIADLGGIDTAYDALQKALFKNGSPIGTIDGLTQSQRFFISYAQTWRENTREQERRMRLSVDPHSPEKYRAIIPATNNPHFDTAFPPSGQEGATKRHLGVW